MPAPTVCPRRCGECEDCGAAQVRTDVARDEIAAALTTLHRVSPWAAYPDAWREGQALDALDEAVHAIRCALRRPRDFVLGEVEA